MFIKSSSHYSLSALKVPSANDILHPLKDFLLINLFPLELAKISFAFFPKILVKTI